MSTVTVAEELLLSESTLTAIRALEKYLHMANVRFVAMTLIKSLGDDTRRVYEAKVKVYGDRSIQQTFQVTVSKWCNTWQMEKISLGSDRILTMQDGLYVDDGLRLDHEVDVLKATALEALIETLPGIVRRVVFDEITIELVGLGTCWFEISLPIRNTSLPQVPIDIISVSVNRAFQATRVECLTRRVGGLFIRNQHGEWEQK